MKQGRKDGRTERRKVVVSSPSTFRLSVLPSFFRHVPSARPARASSPKGQALPRRRRRLSLRADAPAMAGPARLLGRGPGLPLSGRAALHRELRRRGRQGAGAPPDAPGLDSRGAGGELFRGRARAGRASGGAAGRAVSLRVAGHQRADRAGRADRGGLDRAGGAPRHRARRAQRRRTGHHLLPDRIGRKRRDRPPRDAELRPGDRGGGGGVRNGGGAGPPDRAGVGRYAFPRPLAASGASAGAAARPAFLAGRAAPGVCRAFPQGPPGRGRGRCLHRRHAGASARAHAPAARGQDGPRAGPRLGAQPHRLAAVLRRGADAGRLGPVSGAVFPLPVVRPQARGPRSGGPARLSHPRGRRPPPTRAGDAAPRHCAIAESAWGQVRELRWLADPARARGILRSFLARQDEAGRLPDRLLLDRTAPRGVQLADWGGSLLAVDEVHPDDDFLAACYVPLCRYAACVDRERDAEGSGLFEASASGDGGRRKGVALTVYQYRLRRALAVAAGRIGRSDEAGAHAAAADRIAESVRGRLWDRDTEMFLDLDPGSGRPAPTKLVTSFYPYMTDLAGAEHLAGLERHLFNRAEFWRPVRVPSLAADEPGYSPDGEMDGVRRNRPVNGRVWPAANCHIAEALARGALALDPRYRQRAGEFLQRFVRMMFSDGDPTRPNAYEHYSPETGRPSAWRGLDDVGAGR